MYWPHLWGGGTVADELLDTFWRLLAGGAFAELFAAAGLSLLWGRPELRFAGEAELTPFPGKTQAGKGLSAFGLLLPPPRASAKK